MSSFAHHTLYIGLLLFLGGSLVAEFDHSHRDWDTVLKAHVQGDLVDYATLSEDSRILDRYLAQLNSVTRAEVDAWSRNKQLAFWINAYNAFTVRVILDHYPIKTWTFKGLVVPRNSIIQIPGVWKQLEWKVAGQSLTIDHIEHGLMRPIFQEPRMHFAIVCASIGCPNLRAEAFTSEMLETQLDNQTKNYLSNQVKGVRLDYENKRVCVSRLFKWFNEDFDVAPSSGFQVSQRKETERIAFQFISHYLADQNTWELLQSPDTSFDYLPYDWSLNELPPSDDSSS